ncbi:MAK10-like protein [Tanacetum coccineum]
MEVEKINEVVNRTRTKSIKTSKSEEAVEAPSSQPVAYYLKHKINEKLIKGLVNNNRFNNSRSRAQDRNKKGKEYNIGNLKHANALVDQGSDVNVMPYFTYMKLTDERPAETDIRLSLASHSYVYPLGIAEDVLVEIVEHVYPIDFVILDIKENENRPFILGTPFLTTAKASIKFDTDAITLRSGKHKLSFHRIPDSSNMTDKGVKNDIEPIAPTMTFNRLVLEWLYLMRRSLEVLKKFHWMILGGRFNQLSHVSSPLLSKPGEY